MTREAPSEVLNGTVPGSGSVLHHLGGHVGGAPHNLTISTGVADGRLHNVDERLHNVDERLHNTTGFFLENDDVDSSFTDLQTLFLACFATLVPLIFTLITAFALRILWKKYRRNRECRTYDGVMHHEESTDALTGSQQSAPLHSHLLNTEKIKICESEFSVTQDDIACTGSPVLYSGNTSRTNHASANGSIITMTLKNNHLIVETEERNDIVEDSRETTMKYSPSAKDGVFVVEVQQGVRRSSTPGPANQGPMNDTSCDHEQRALVHNPPQRYSDDDTLDETDEAYYPETTSPGSLHARKSSSAYTGLSQSTLSMTSADGNVYYRYGNQQEYDNGYYGYPQYNGYLHEDPPIRPRNNKPKITSALYKQSRLTSMVSMDPEGQLVCDLPRRKSENIESEEAQLEEQMRLGNIPRKSMTENGGVSVKQETEAEPNGRVCENGAVQVETGNQS